MKLDEVRRIAVIGAGLMGHAIAMEFALAGYAVGLQDVTEEKIEEALKRIRANLEMLATAGLVSPEQIKPALSGIHGATDLGAVVTDADVVVESALENLSVKQQIFGELDRICPARTILASNTSSLMPSDLAAATKRPDKVLIAHYFNPPYLLPLVELVRSDKTSEESTATLYEVMKKVGKRPVVIQKAVPGFIGVRLQVALLREAASLVQNGVASAQDVDTVIKNSFGRRLALAGVFEVSDLAGWDIVASVNANLLPKLENSTELSPLLKQKVERWELGAKTGKGFYDWASESGERRRKRIIQGLVKLAQYSRAD
jgi:3-hydroxybutyryl-CoA dehydrogenase